MSEAEIANSLDGIAIIGMAGRFPDAKNIDEFWQNLQNGVESIRFFSDEELLAAGVDPAALNDPNYVKAGSKMEDVELFDAAFFGFNPREAAVMDPQHRIFLECAWEAVENAGYDAHSYAGRIGTYAGVGFEGYLLFNIAANPHLLGGGNGFQTLLGNEKDFLTTRVSYQLNLKGPSLDIQTACSTSLVSVSLACQSLLNYQCDMALAGGVTISIPRKAGYFYQQGGVLSPDGHCRAFDAKGQGTILGDGVGIVVLKRLEEALADGDCIHAVIKGFGMNNDGALKVGYTAPSVDGQADAIAEAIALADIDPETITYIETHGTGTPLGDPIEIAALTKVFRAHTQKRNFCAIGALKTNIGHLDAAAGVAGLIKTVLALKHQQIPPSLNFETPNPQIDFASSPFYVNTQLADWKSNGTPRRAGVSSFGLGGTNVHVIVEEAPLIEQGNQGTEEQGRKYHLLTLSAKTHSALEKATENLANYLQQHPDLNLADVAYTLQQGRRSFNHRRAVVCQDIEDALVALQDPKRTLTNIQETNERPIAFMFSGLGTHYVNMGRELYQNEPIFRQEVNRCCELLQPILNLDLREVLYPHQNQPEIASQPQKPPGFDLRKMLGRSEEKADAATQKLNQTFLSQPATFVIEYALAQLWMSWGIRPQAMIGYSIGEYVAACVAGVLSLEDALTLVAKRAQLIQSLPSGAMVAVPLSEKEVQPFLNENLSLSAVNGLSLCVVAGSPEAIEALETQLTHQGLVCRRIVTSHAFHSHMMEAIAHPFTELVKTFKLNPPKIPYISNVTGTWITTSEATEPNYWTKHLCQPVRFADGIQALWKKQNSILLEVGPGQILCSLALQCLEGDRIAIPSLRAAYDTQSDLAFFLNAFGQLWLTGTSIDWSILYAHQTRRRIPLPTYPFERQRYWVELQKQAHQIALDLETSDEKLDVTDWFHIPSWKRSKPISFNADQLRAKPQTWLIFLDECGVGLQLLERLKREQQSVILVKIGEEFSCLDEGIYTINPHQRGDYDALIQSILNLGQIPTIISHLWTITPDQCLCSNLEELNKFQSLGFYSLLFLAQALGEQAITQPLQIHVISNGLQEVVGEQELSPEKATILGPCRVIPQEYSSIKCRSIDIVLPQSHPQQWQQLIDQLLAEFQTDVSDPVIAYRGNHRWVQYYEPSPLEKKTIANLREQGVYLITGGLGGIGLVIAEHLAKTVQAKLVLIGRSGLPPKSDWTQWLSSHHDEDLVSQRIKKVQHLEELGAEVFVLQADVAHLEQMQTVVQQVRDRFGEIHGVIHAAGVPGAGVIQLKTSEMAATVFEPKLKGTLVLDAVLKETNLDFLVLFSSNTAITGGIGQVDYCAANAFLDAFARYKSCQSQPLTVAINWDWWQGDNWADSLMASVPEIQATFKQMRDKYGITFAEGVDAFTRILSSQLPQVIVSTQKLEKMIENDSNLSQSSSQSKSRHPRPNLSTVYVPPSNTVEQKIADLWQELLGIEKVGIHDNFFDLGGHSLLATQLISQLRQDFQVDLSLRSLFEAPTICDLALTIEEMLIAELETLTEDEVHQLEIKLEA